MAQRCFTVLLLMAVVGVALTAAKPLDGEATSSTTVAGTSNEAATAVAGTAATPSGRKYLTAEDVPLCHEKNADLGACVQRVFEIMMPRLKNGDASLNIPSLDPLTLNRTTLQAQVGPVTGRIVMKNGIVYGLSDMQYHKVDMRVNGNKIKMFTHATAPNVRIEGNYKADMSVNNVHLRPKGFFNLTLKNMDMKTESDSTLYDQDGHRFVHVDSLKGEPALGDMKINITGIFPDPELNDIVVNVMNERWRDIYAALLPEAIKYMTPFLTKSLNDVLSVVPFDNFVKSR